MNIPPHALHRFKPGNPGKPFGAGRASIKHELAELGFNWIREAVSRYRDPKTPSASKDYVLGLITDRVAPKLKAIELSTDRDSLSKVMINIISGSELSESVVVPAVEVPVLPAADAEVQPSLTADAEVQPSLTLPLVAPTTDDET